MHIRVMTLEDIDFALKLTSQEGWSDIRSDFVSLITYKPAGAFIIEEHKSLVGMISVVSYGVFGFIGSLIVLPNYRQRGFGSELMRYAMTYLQNNGSKTIRIGYLKHAEKSAGSSVSSNTISFC